MFIQPHVCIDDFGSAVYRCHATGELTVAENAAFTGPMIPGVSARYVVSKSDEAKAAMKLSRAEFDAMDANCNTCYNLARVKHSKSADGFLYGTCPHKDEHPRPYAERDAGAVMMFHPSDPMLMPCHKLRQK